MSKDSSHLIDTNYQVAQAGADSCLLQADSPVMETDFFVSAQWLHDQICQEASNLIVLDVTRGKGNYPLEQNRTSEDYALGHIPGAIHLNTDELGEFKDYFNTPEQMREVFLKKGVHKDSQVVFYSIYARDILYIASRMAFAAYYLGVDQVKILDGGLQAWQRAGYPLETQENKGRPCDHFGCDVPARPEIYLRTPEDLVTYRKEHPESLLASVRTWNEYLGVNEGHQWNKGSGEIAGARYLGDELIANVQGELAAPSVYLSQWQKWGITPDQEVILYCGTSWRSSTAFFLLKHLGWKRVVMFDGSWYKYYLAHQEDPEQFPIQRGNPMGEPALEIIDERR